MNWQQAFSRLIGEGWAPADVRAALDSLADGGQETFSEHDLIAIRAWLS